MLRFIFGRFKKLPVIKGGLISVVVFLLYSNCQRVQYSYDYNVLQSGSTSGLVINEGKATRVPHVSVRINLDYLSETSSAEYEFMRLALQGENRESKKWIPFNKSTEFQFPESFAADGSKDGIKSLIVEIRVKGSTNLLRLDGQFVLDTLPPTFLGLSINNNADLTRVNYSKLQVHVEDKGSPVINLCFKSKKTPPSVSDKCWIPLGIYKLSEKKILKATEIPFLLGFLPSRYTVFAFAMDQAGNVTSLLEQGSGKKGFDKNDIYYDPPIPPVMIDVFATNSEQPNYPPKREELIVKKNETVYISWNVVEARGGLGPTPMRLYFTMDEVSYIPIASELKNSSNGGCNLVNGATGCYLWKSTVDESDYFRIRVGVKDKNDQITYVTALPLNSKSFNQVAGNTDPGLGGSASAAIFFNYNSSSYFQADPQSLVITNSGNIIFRDIKRGIILVQPENGIQQVLVPLKEGIERNGSLPQATLSYPFAKIALDYQDRIVVSDLHSVRIIDLEKQTIEPVIGGGVNSVLENDVTAFDFKYENCYNDCPIIPLPNGDLFFMTARDLNTTSGGAGLRLYKSKDTKISKFIPTGLESAEYPTWNINSTENFLNNAVIEFDPNTSEIRRSIVNMQHPVVGGRIDAYSTIDFKTMKSFTMDKQIPNAFNHGYDSVNFLTDRVGEIYAFSRLEGFLKKYNKNANSWEPILGTGIFGQCEDGTLANECNVDLQSVFVGLQEQIYFADRGRIRTITADNKVITIVGQSFSFGDSGLATSARFGMIKYFDQTKNGKVTLLDSAEVRFRDFSIDGKIQTIAGNGNEGSPNSSVAAPLSPMRIGYWGAYYSFSMNRDTGDLFIENSTLNRQSGKWSPILGFDDGVSYLDADGLPGKRVFTQYPFIHMGYGNSQLLASTGAWDSSNGGFSYGAMLKLFDNTNGEFRQKHLAGNRRVTVGSYSADGVLLSDADVPSQFGQSNLPAIYSSENDEWYTAQLDTNSIKILKAGIDQRMRTLVNLPRNIQSFTYVLSASNEPVIYYCSAGRIYKYNIISKLENALAWPTETINCFGHSLVWNKKRSSLLFSFTQNSLSAFGEIFDKP